ncbi:MAG TPA: aminotransferase class V-fold PLP-dependent enzyme [Bryobacteraceae bacterium]|jgi:cysteine desulfurase/selenocysteine lyase|nr:aminotransferase class V-fold PLP-dependent enzyme [Bryobacteraceae bacterium]
MGFKNLMDYRDLFPVTKSLIYLNHAAVAPLSLRAASAMESLARDVLENGSFHYEQWNEAYAGARQAAARLINASCEEIALMKNTSEGISTIALGLDWRAGDSIVAFHEEFPSNQYPWQRLEAKGVKIRWRSVTDPLDRIDEAARGARLLAISFVQFLTGYRANLNAIGQICRDRGVFFFVDAIQGLGAFPLDVRAANIGALAADGHKWLLGPEGCAILYVSRELQDQIDPVEFGWTNVAGFEDYGKRDMSLRADAGRYECGTLNTIGCYGLRAALELVLEIGVERIAPRVQSLADRIDCGARQKGYQTASRRTADSGAGIVSVRKSGVEADAIAAQLRQNRVSAASRAGWVRMSPHFYVTEEEIDRALAALC